MSVFTRKKRYDVAELGNSSGTLLFFDLTAYGVAAVVGSGIFAIVGRTALQDAGLAAPLSVLIAGGLSLATAICYLEFASAFPVPGSSSFAYFYGMVGEIWGWAAGWNLTLEYAFAAAAVACSWSEGLRAVFDLPAVKASGLYIPDRLFSLNVSEQIKIYPMAAIIVIFFGFLVSRGVKLGAKLTNAISLLNITLILLIVAVGAMFVQPNENWFTGPYLLPSKGWSGVVEGGSHMFFAFIGYDTVSTLSGDAANPARDVPMAVFATLAVATSFYVGVVAVLTGMVRWERLSADCSLVRAFLSIEGARWAAPIVSIGSLTTMAATIMACLIGQPKIFRAMAEDGLLPHWFAGSLGISLRTTVILTAALALFVDFNAPNCGIADAISFGVLLGMSAIGAGLLVVRVQQSPKAAVNGTRATLLYLLGCLVFSFFNSSSYSRTVLAISFILCVCVPYVFLHSIFSQHRHQLPSLSPAFACPGMPFMPAISILANCVVLMTTWQNALLPFSVWTGLGLLIYFTYGQYHSKLVKTV